MRDILFCMEKFKALGLNPELIKAVEDLGFETPSEVQEKAIPLLLEEESDFIGLAQTGTGKTAAFGLPLLQNILVDSKQTQGLILSPTRELCLQISKELALYAKYMKGINIVAVYGGASITEQERQIKRGAQVIVATPGRMKDMLRRNMIDISAINYCVLDEADEMLNMGFYEDITDILSHSPQTKKTWLFSATMPKEVSTIAKEFMNAPIEVTVGSKNEGSKNVSHEYYLVNARDRYKALKRLVDANPGLFAVTFCRTKRDTQKVAERLTEDGYNAAALHGDLSQSQRDLVMNGFRNRQIQILVATDVAARGIDVDDITHVINYQLPDEIEVYTHRSGRTGRAGKTGVSMVLVTKGEKQKIKRIEKIIKQKFEQKEIPSGEAICQVQLLHHAQTIKNTDTNPGIEEYIGRLEEEFKDLDKSEFIKKVFSVEFSRFHDYYKNAEDLNTKAQQTYSEAADSGNSIRYFINVGERDGFTWQSLKDFLRDELKLGRDDVSHVDVKNNFSFFNTDMSAQEKVMAFFENFSHQGRSVNVEITKNSHGKKSRGRRFDRSSRGGGRNNRSDRRDRSRGNRESRRSKDFSPKKGSKGGRKANIKSSVSRRRGRKK